MSYDGNGSLGEALAKLYGYSSKNQKVTAKHISGAKNALGLVGVKSLTPEQKLMVYAFHSDKQKPPESVLTDPFALVKLSLKIGDRRTVLSLERYLVDLMKVRFGLASNANVSRWIEANISGKLDPSIPLTKQVVYAIVMALIG